MTVISITITASESQVLPGIPTSITLSTDIPSIIFYTLDGTSPTPYSQVYIGQILLPGLSSITLTIFATDGADSSAIIQQQYSIIESEMITQAGDRLPHAKVSPLNTGQNVNQYPFGSNSPNPYFVYENTADAGTTVYDPELPAQSQGFDANDNPAVFTNQDPSYYQFNTLYSTQNYDGEVFPGVGNLPAMITIKGSQYDVEYRQEVSSTADKLFNPKALVIYQDASTEDPTNPVIINRNNMSLESPEIVRDGNLLFNHGLDAPPTMGGFVNRFYNPRENTLTSSYYDNTVGRWIFSKQPFQSTNPNVGNLSMVQPGRQQGNGLVFQWHWGLYRTLI